MTTDSTSPSGRLAIRSGSATAPITGVWSWFAPSVPLLPILVVYVLRAVLFSSLPGDEGSYIAYARNLTHGYYAATDLGYLWHGPGLPALLVPFVALHVPLAVTRVIFGPVVLFATIVVFHRMTRFYVRERTALVATYGLALYLPFFGVLGTIWVEPVAAFWLTLSAFFMVRSFRGGRRDHLWAGIALAMLALSRVEYGYVLMAALALSCLWLVVSRRSFAARRSALALALALLLCTPWLAYTYSLTNKPFYWGSSGGLSLYWMTAPGNLGDWHHASDPFSMPQLAVDRPVFTEIARLGPVAQDARLQHIAIQNIKNHPKHYFSNVLNNIGRLLFNSPYSFTNEKVSPMFYAVPNMLLLSLLAIALVVAIRVRRRLGLEIVPIAVFAALGFAVHVPVAAYGRFFIPLVPVLLWLVVAVIGPNVRLATDDRSPAPAPA
jgi:4-amino-4-deoxy-L-arabinose transferase-like glycosyltransferase